jgi:transitional endoplasmic reticulum ATPase
MFIRARRSSCTSCVYVAILLFSCAISEQLTSPKWPVSLGVTTEHFILHEGPTTFTRELLVAAGVWSDQLHQEIWVYNQTWQKNAGLWHEIQKGSWDAVILEDGFKQAIQKDVFGFFSSKDTYKGLTLPWKVL